MCMCCRCMCVCVSVCVYVCVFIHVCEWGYMNAMACVWRPADNLLSVLTMHLGWDRVSCSSIHKQVSCTARFEEFSCLCFSSHCRDTKITGGSIPLHVALCGFGVFKLWSPGYIASIFAHWTISPTVLAVFITSSKDLSENTDNV